VVFKTDATVDARFLHYLLRSPQLIDQYQSLAEGGNQVGKRRRIYWSVLREHALLLPPLPEQQKIAAILSSVDEAIEATDAVIAQLQAVKKAMMADLLTKGLPGRHTDFRDTPLGLLPESWTVRAVGDVIEETAYGTSAKCHVDAGEGGLPVLRIPNVVSGRVDLSDLKRAVVSTSEAQRYGLLPGDILIVRTNGNPEYVGRSAVVPSHEGPWLYASYLIRIRVRSEIVASEFLHVALQSEPVRKTMEGAIRTSAGNYNLNTQGIAKTMVPLPPLDEQQRIVDAAGTLSSRVDAELEGRQGLITLKAALMTALFTGDIRVDPTTTAQPEVAA
jgi:type I restriction enzyme S subunit